MLRMFRKVHSHRVVAQDSDEIVAWCPLPDGGVLNNVWLDCQLIFGVESVIAANTYGLSGYVMRVPDPTNVILVDALWDAMVPKDTGMGPGILDGEIIDVEAAPEYELGVTDATEIFDATEEMTPLFERFKILTAARAHIVNEATSQYFPTDEFSVKIGKKVRVARRSMVLFGVSLPDNSFTTATVDGTPAMREWNVLKYMGEALKAAFIEAINLLEAAADEPYTELSNIVADFLEPPVLEDTAGAFSINSLDIFTKATFDVSVPGLLDVSNLSGG